MNQGKEVEISVLSTNFLNNFFQGLLSFIFYLVVTDRILPQTGRITSNGLQAPSASHLGLVQLSSRLVGKNLSISFRFVNRLGGRLTPPALGSRTRTATEKRSGSLREGRAEPSPLFRYVWWCDTGDPTSRFEALCNDMRVSGIQLLVELLSGGFWTIRTGARFLDQLPYRRGVVPPLPCATSSLGSWGLTSHEPQKAVVWSLCDDGDGSCGKQEKPPLYGAQIAMPGS